MSTFIGETLYAILLAVVGLVLFAHLIGKVQVLSSMLYAMRNRILVLLLICSNFSVHIPLGSVCVFLLMCDSTY